MRERLNGASNAFKAGKQQQKIEMKTKCGRELNMSDVVMFVALVVERLCTTEMNK